MRVLPLLMLVLGAAPAAAQEEYQSVVQEGPDGGPFRLGLYGFAARGGVDFEGEKQALVSVALDLGDLYTDRLRLRPSGELGFAAGANTYVANVEVVYRFTADTVIAVPYVAGGVGVFGREACDPDPDCPAVWAQFALGFELKLRAQFNWLLEYHAEDAFRRHRLFLGLTTRRGS